MAGRGMMQAPEGTKGVLVPGIGEPIYFPETMEDDQIALAIERDILPQRADILKEQIRASREKMFSEMPAGDRFLAGAGRGLMNVGAGVKQLGMQAGEAVGIVEPGSAARYTKERQEEYGPLDEATAGNKMNTFGRIIGEAAPLALIPGGAPARLGRMALTGAAGGAVAANIPFVEEGESRTGRTVGGALGGAAGSLLIGGLGKAVNAARGRFANQAEGALVRQAKQEGINLSVGDATGNPLIQKVEVLQENLPGILGTSKFRQEGSQQVTEAVNRRVTQLRDSMRSTPFETMEALNAAAAKGNDEARVILGQISESGDDWNRIIQASGNLKRFNVKRQADALYDEVRNLSGEGNIPVSRSKAALQEVIREMETSKVPAAKVATLKKILGNLTEADDFEGALLKAGQSATDAGGAATTRAAVAKAAEKAARAVDREKTSAVSNAGKAAQALGKYKKYGTDFGWWYDEALAYAKTAAQNARAAAETANARGAVGGLAKDQAETAARRAEQSMRELAIADGTATLAKSQNPEAAARVLIQKYKLAGEDLQGALAEATRRVSGAPARVGGVDNSFRAMMKFRSDLRNMAEDVGITNPNLGRLLRKVKTAAEQDMADYAQSGGFDPNSAARYGLQRMWKKADTFYRTEVVPLKERSLTNALKGADPDEIAWKFLKFNKFDRAKRFYDALDPKGQAAVRYGLLERAAEEATNQAQNFVSPAQFAGKIEKFDGPTRAFFQGQARRELDGFVKLMRAVERHGRFAENPPTGNRMAQLAVSGGIVGAPALGFLSAATVGKLLLSSAALRLLFTTDKGRNLLLAAARQETGSKGMNSALEGILRALRAPAAVTAGAALSTQFEKQKPKEEAP